VTGFRPFVHSDETYVEVFDENGEKLSDVTIRDIQKELENPISLFSEEGKVFLFAKHNLNITVREITFDNKEKFIANIGAPMTDRFFDDVIKTKDGGYLFGGSTNGEIQIIKTDKDFNF